MLHENQIPEAETFMIEVSLYEKHLIRKAIGDSIHNLEKYIESSKQQMENSSWKNSFDKEINNLKQKVIDLKRVSERIK